MSDRDFRLYLHDIAEAIQTIAKYTEGYDYEGFSSNPIVIDAVIRNFLVIGEAVRKVPKDIMDAHPDLPWKKMSDMRNKLVHDYLNVDASIIWETVLADLPLLAEKISQVLKNYS
ncbi:MAG: DUF86 domain-containing protein [Thermodesulfovibrionales bacterium]|nr:DUF86 domain-containing protein [Thermodesulfovibrionales bacterium]